VKILFDKENALMHTGSQLVICYLNEIMLLGQPISSHCPIMREREDQASPTTQEQELPEHLFTLATMHFSKIPTSRSENDLHILFSSNGCILKEFKFFQKPQVTLIQMSSYEEANQVFIQLHNHHLWLSFSKLA
ncbi:Polypyrimidine tract-binding protein 1, partial [Galemys pyrenaicus]